MLKQRTEQIFLNGTPLVQIIGQLQECVKKYGEDAFLSVEVSYEYGDTYVVSNIEYESEENLLEAAEREAAEKADKERILKHKREQYEALKKEFGE